MKLSRKARPTLIMRIHAKLAKIAAVRSGSRNNRRWTASKALIHSTRTMKMTLQKLVSDGHHHIAMTMTRRTPTKHPVQVFEISFSRERYVISSFVDCPRSSSATDRSQSQHGLGTVYVPWPRAFMGWPTCARACLGKCPRFIRRGPPNLTFRRTNQPHGDDRNGSSEATSTMERFSLVAGAV